MADDGQIIYGKQPGRRGRAGEAAGAPGLAGAGDLGRGAGAALRVARPPGGRRRGRSLSLRGDREALLREEDALLVALDQVQDPRNLGAVCRSAEFAGAAGVVIPERRAAEVTAVACKASAGAVEHLEIARVRNLADWLGRGEGGGLLDLGRRRRRPSSRPGRSTSPGPTVLVLGGEGKGIRPRVAAACDGLVALPQAGPGRLAQRLGRRHRAALRGGPPAPERLAHCNGVCTKSQFGVDRTPRGRKTTAPTRVNLSLSLRSPGP